ncbi:MAG: hypothetical protein ACRDRL_20480, partial [Sciscionella sp.]
FLMYGPNTNLGSGSIIYMLERQADYIAALTARLARGDIDCLDVRAESEQRWDTEIQSRLERSVWTRCTSWYRTRSGRVTTNWPGLLSEYGRRTAAPDFADYRLPARGEVSGTAGGATFTRPDARPATPATRRPGSRAARRQ